MLAKRPKWTRPTTLAVLLVAVMIAGCTFTDGQAEQKMPDTGMPIEHTLDATGIDQTVLAYADQVITDQINAYTEGWKDIAPDCAITAARLTGLTEMETGTSGNTDGITMYQLEYRLRLDGDINKVLAGGMQEETVDGETWIEEWSSAGQPYLLFHWQDTDSGTVWEPICVLSDDTLLEYNTAEMLEQYGNAYTAAAMELYAKGPDTAIPVEHTFDETGLAPDVLMYADQVITDQIEKNKEGWKDIAPGTHVTAARLTDLTEMETGTSGNTDGLILYRMDCSLRVEGGNPESLLIGGVTLDTIDGETWLKGSFDAGYTYLLFHWADTSSGTVWEPICVTDDEGLQNAAVKEGPDTDGTYTGAVMSLYEKSKGMILPFDARAAAMQ